MTIMKKKNDSYKTIDKKEIYKISVRLIVEIGTVYYRWLLE